MKKLMLMTILLSFAATSGGGQPTPPLQSDHELATQAVSRGEFLPLDVILETVAKTVPGQLIELELELDDEIWVYEVEIKTPEGRLIEIDLNAATGEIIEVADGDID